MNNTVRLQVAKQATIKTGIKHKILFVSKWQKFIKLESDEQLFWRKQVLFDRRINEVLPNRPLYALIFYAASVKIYLRKQVVNGQSGDKLQGVLDT